MQMLNLPAKATYAQKTPVGAIALPCTVYPPHDSNQSYVLLGDPGQLVPPAHR
jgi:hypothetical protein